MATQKKIAVIGAGPSGLTAIKSCQEEGLSAVCFERNADPGSLWKYHDEDIEGVPSVMRTTIINTSKEMSAFSDYPPPKEYPNYMHNSKMFNYFMMYAERFDLMKHIRFHSEVVKVKQTEDFDQTGRWFVSVKNVKTGEISEEEFDAVMVCIGHHVYPNIPTFPDQRKFKGTILHTHSLKSCDQFKGKKVVVIGIGNSGVDAAIDSTFVAEQVYLSTRRGSWISRRVGINGRPFDADVNTRLNFFFYSFMTFSAKCSRLEKFYNAHFDHEAYNLKPKHRVFSQHPTINDALPNAILSGRVVIKGDVERFEENGIKFVKDGDKVTEADVVILATGYHVKFTFLDKDILPTNDNRVHLLKYSIPPNLKHSTLAIIGLIQPLGSIFPISEMQSRWFIQIQTGKLKLPTSQAMEKDIEKKTLANKNRYVDSPRHTIQVDFVPFMDELAEMIGVKPNFMKMAITDPRLFRACITGPALPYQYRLVGPHSWAGAREAILTYEDRVLSPLNSEGKNMSVSENRFNLKKLLGFLIIASVGIIAIKISSSI